MFNWNRIKYYLGLRCVVGVGQNWYITKTILFMRHAQGTENGHWWYSTEYWPKYCAYSTKEEAVAALNKFDIKF